jgi:hypothetical protein
MSAQELMHAQKRRGRKPTGKGTPVQVRLAPNLLARIDAWIETLPDPRPTRADAIRSILRERFEPNED